MQAFQAEAQRPQNPRSAEFVEQFGEYLLAQGLGDKNRVRQAQLAQRESGERFDLVLMRLGLLTDAAMAKALAAYCGLTLVTANDFPSEALLPDRVDVGFLKLNRLLPFADRIDHVAVAVADPFNDEAIASLSYLIDRPVERCVVADGDLDSAIDRLYGAASQSAAGGNGRDFSSNPVLGAETASEEDVQRLEDMASEAPVIRLVQELIVRAVTNQASDIHVEPREDSVRIRFRIDGVLQTVETLATNLKSALGSRIKIMAKMNIAERRMPQDGRIKVNVRGREIDLRVSTMPTLWGESIVMRILDRSSVELDFPKLGFAGRGFEDLNLLLQQPNGIILVTGPTGSGKTTTLYTALSELNTSERKIFTVEDPIEYQLPGINQIQVQPKIGLTFAHALRSILRQDPDIIMVGEIRDLETAQMAVQASLTGHLVLSTVHTNSATATITRLLDMGVEKYLLTSTLKGVLAQRLVRRLCKACAEPSNDAANLMQMLSATGVNADALMAGETLRPHRAVGCPACRQRGYSGRTTIYELLTTTARMRETILSTTSEAVLEKAAVADKMTTMLQNGLIKALRGETTPEEVLRVTRFDGELAPVAS
jgi:general secretion pathway protein E